MNIHEFEAEPYPLEFDIKATALVMIDMQRDFVEGGGFGEMLGNNFCFPKKQASQLISGWNHQHLSLSGQWRRD